MSCRTTREVVPVAMERVSRDTIYVQQARLDSVYVYEGLERIRDTVRVQRVEYRLRWVRDTVYRVVRDSVPYEVRVVETREVARPLGWYDRMARGCLWAVVGVVVVWVVRRRWIR